MSNSKIAELAAAQEKRKKQVETQTQANGRTILTTNRFLREITSDTLQALNAANDPPELFRAGSEIIRVSNNDEIEPVTVAALRGCMDRAADFMKFDRNGEPVPARPPEDVARDILSLPARKLPFPHLQGVRHAPLFLKCGRLLVVDGYDKGSGWLLRLRGLDGIKSNLPLVEARHWLDELLHDFPFEDEASKTHAVALLLQAFLRELIDGATPMYLIDAPARGTGKGLLADVLTSVPTGGDAAVTSLPADGDELEKRITSLLLAGRSHIQFDNVRRLRSAHLEAALTTLTWSGRRLGKSETVYIPNRATWLATGNNIELSDEMARRTIPIRLDAGVERPEDRAKFKHELPTWAYRNRPQLVSACLSVIESWIDAGQPQSTPTLGRYEAWAKVMGGLVGFAGYGGFLSNRKRLQGQADSETQEWTATVKIWWELHKERPITATDLFEVLKEHSLLLDLWGGRAKTGALQRIGHALSRKRDRVYGDLTIRTAGHDSLNRSNAYRLEPNGGGYHKTPETPNTPSAEPETTDFIDFSGNDATGGFEFDDAKTPTKPRKNPGQKTLNSIDLSGFSGISGVLKPPQPDEQSDDREPAIEVEEVF
ncbi:MAG: hypothetical protein KGZ54_11875 [Dethiobacter sp.]|nr:hypothetical protein [Dethiobacter sp.]MBS3902696.1 hypothetical protein [Dethiobacter sp.]MBS3989731.1 hypothetical protein [Dethiobacter sp.]